MPEYFKFYIKLAELFLPLNLVNLVGFVHTKNGFVQCLLLLLICHIFLVHELILAHLADRNSN